MQKLINRTVGILLLMVCLLTPVHATTITEIYDNGYEPPVYEIMDTVYGAGNYYRIDDDSDQFLYADNLEFVQDLPSYSVANNRFEFGEVEPGKWLACIVTNLSWTQNSCTYPTFNQYGLDYVVTYGLFSDSSLRILGFEDWPMFTAYHGPGDFDFNDKVVVVRLSNNITETPEPAAVFLFGAGLLGIVSIIRKQSTISS